MLINKMTLTTTPMTNRKILLSITCVFVATFMITIYKGHIYKGEETQSNESCLVVSKDNENYIICNRDNAWFAKFKFINGKWRSHKSVINRDDFQLLDATQILTERINNMPLKEGPYIFYEPLKDFMDFYFFSQDVIGVAVDNRGDRELIVIRTNENFYEYIYIYTIYRGSIDSYESKYYKIIY